eukprot:612449-Pyramimonas_sp.AAC.1
MPPSERAWFFSCTFSPFLSASAPPYSARAVHDAGPVPRICGDSEKPMNGTGWPCDVARRAQHLVDALS